MQKDITEMKLKSDVLTSTNDGLKNEKEHLVIELRETRDLQKSYEEKTQQLMGELETINKEYSEVKRQMVGHNELKREREERIEKLKSELMEIYDNHDNLDIEFSTLKINYAKTFDMHAVCSKDLDSTTEKLHLCNRVRHETEIKLGAEVEKVKNLQEIVRMKEEILEKRQSEIEDLDKRVIDFERQVEAGEIKRQGLERAGELKSKQQAEKIASLNELLAAEKETRESWIQRFEKEQAEHTETNKQLLQAKSDHKDALLATKNAEIQLLAANRQVGILESQNRKYQQLTNEAVAKNENNERELATQKEILR
jgi:chromosome segregation ATPase